MTAGGQGIGVKAQADLAMSDHVIVCGLQGVALRTVEQFHLSGTRAWPWPTYRPGHASLL
ncbi:MAG TPA: hypothetical protein VGI44_12425 [Acidimicrobiales bacterium]